MPLLPWIDENEAAGRVAELYNLWKLDHPGHDRIPPILKCFSPRPDLLEQVSRMLHGLYSTEGHLTRRHKELIGTYVSTLNECQHCRGIHAAQLERAAGGETATMVRNLDLENASISDADRALLHFAGKLTLQSHGLRAEDYDRLRSLGWNNDQITEAVYLTALFAQLCRIANAFGLEETK